MPTKNLKAARSEQLALLRISLPGLEKQTTAAIPKPRILQKELNSCREILKNLKISHARYYATLDDGQEKTTITEEFDDVYDRYLELEDQAELILATCAEEGRVPPVEEKRRLAKLKHENEFVTVKKRLVVIKRDIKDLENPSDAVVANFLQILANLHSGFVNEHKESILEAKRYTRNADENVNYCVNFVR